MRNVLFGILTFFSVVLFLGGCGFMVDEFQWELGHGELPQVIGDVDVSYENRLIPDYDDFEDFHRYIEHIPFKKPTGKWFGSETLGYGIPSGTMLAGDDFEILLFGHDPSGVTVDRMMRIQLHELHEGYELGERVLEEEVYVEVVDGTEEIYSNALPEKEDISYVVSLEVLDQQGEVEDTLLGLIYVPAPEVNARLVLDQDIFEYVDDEKEREEVLVTLTLENFGPTFLSFGEEFVIEKLVEDDWRVAPVGLSFKSIGVYLGIGDSYEQTYDVSDLRRGTYRFVKTFYVDGLEEEQTVAVEFTVE